MLVVMMSGGRGADRTERGQQREELDEEGQEDGGQQQTQINTLVPGRSGPDHRFSAISVDGWSRMDGMDGCPSSSPLFVTMSYSSHSLDSCCSWFVWESWVLGSNAGSVDHHHSPGTYQGPSTTTSLLLPGPVQGGHCPMPCPNAQPERQPPTTMVLSSLDQCPITPWSEAWASRWLLPRAPESLSRASYCIVDAAWVALMASVGTSTI
ncbi:hypothetical protein QBC39DRAFT_140142 [Podospora conica]|nr:hypothetical protein QBC39DRAFT_140142 [Schizothecium conicum]